MLLELVAKVQWASIVFQRSVINGLKLWFADGIGEWKDQHAISQSSDDKNICQDRRLSALIKGERWKDKGTPKQMAETNYMRFDCIDDIVHHTLICAIMIIMEPKKIIFAAMHFGEKSQWLWCGPEFIDGLRSDLTCW